MKQVFEDGSYVEIQASPKGKIFITIAAKQSDNPLESVVNSVEISRDDFLYLVSDLAPPVQIPSVPVSDGYLQENTIKDIKITAKKKSPSKKKRTTKKKTTRKKTPRKTKKTKEESKE